MVAEEDGDVVPRLLLEGLQAEEFPDLRPRRQAEVEGVFGVVGLEAREPRVVPRGLGVDQVPQEDEAHPPRAQGLRGAEALVGEPLPAQDPPEEGEVGVEVPEGDDPHPFRRLRSSP